MLDSGGVHLPMIRFFIAVRVDFFSGGGWKLANTTTKSNPGEQPDW